MTYMRNNEYSNAKDDIKISNLDKQHHYQKQTNQEEELVWGKENELILNMLSLKSWRYIHVEMSTRKLTKRWSLE